MPRREGGPPLRGGLPHQRPTGLRLRLGGRVLEAQASSETLLASRHVVVQLAGALEREADVVQAQLGHARQGKTRVGERGFASSCDGVGEQRLPLAEFEASRAKYG